MQAGQPRATRKPRVQVGERRVSGRLHGTSEDGARSVRVRRQISCARNANHHKETAQASTRLTSTHERPYALPAHVHRDRRERTGSLARPEDEERALDPGGAHAAVGEERGRVVGRRARDVREREDVRPVRAVRVEQVRERRRARDDEAEAEHPVHDDNSQCYVGAVISGRPDSDTDTGVAVVLGRQGGDVRDARDCADPRHVVRVPDGPADEAKHAEEHAEHEGEAVLGFVDAAVALRQPDDPTVDERADDDHREDDTDNAAEVCEALETDPFQHGLEIEHQRGHVVGEGEVEYSDVRFGRR